MSPLALPEKRRPFPERRWPHYASIALPVLMIGAIGYLATRPWRVTDWNPLSAWAQSAPLLSLTTAGTTSYLLALYASFYAGLLHDSRPCIVCAAKLPLDPASAAGRARPALRLRHLAQDKLGWKIIVVYTAVLFGLPAGWPSNIWAIGSQAAIVAVLLAVWWHEKLQPWCPWCRHDDGDDSTKHQPEPDPSERMPA
jgi:hypothetical protein